MPGRLSATLAALVLAACHPHPTSPDIPPPTAADEVELLPSPKGAPTWENWAGAFVRDYCVECHGPTATCGGDGCHSPGDSRLLDYRDKAAFLQNADAIRCGIAATSPADCAGSAPHTLPKWNGYNPLPTDRQRALMVAWLAAGAP